jgi:WD40 repeat protein
VSRSPKSPRWLSSVRFNGSPGAKTRIGYDAFISYSHAADGLVAPALQAGLQAVGKPWYRRRALRAFRDVTSLSATPELWPTIERALERSRYFILLASPSSARSAWVEQEVRWWRERRADDTLLIVVTDGELGWDVAAGDFSGSSVVPSTARGWFEDEPLWVDLRWATDQEQLSTRNPRFLSDVASLAAPIRGIDKDELVGEDVRQHRRTIRLARGAAAMLAALTIAAIASAIFAENQRRVADTERREAQRQTAEATSVALASSATPLLDERPDVSLLLALEAYRASPRVEARSSMLAALRTVREARVLAFLHGHSNVVFDVACSPDGHTLASASWDDTIRLWNMRTHKQIGLPLTGHTGDVLSVAFSPDGETLASGGEDAVRLWDVRSHRQLGAPISGETNSVAFSPDGSTVASGGQGTHLWDRRSHKQLAEPLGGAEYVFSVGFSPDGRTLASGTQAGAIRLWNIGAHKPLGRPLTATTGYVEHVAFSPNGRTLASSDGVSTRLWDVPTQQPHGHPLSGSAGTFSPDGHTLASVDNNNSINLWNLRSHKRVRDPLFGHSDVVRSLAFSRDGRTLASASDDTTIRLWDIRAPKPIDKELTGHRGAVLSLAFSPDRRTLASASDDRTIRFWDIHTDKPLGAPLIAKPLSHHRLPHDVFVFGSIFNLAFSPNGRTLASTGDDHAIRLWDVRTHDPLGRPLRGHTASVTSLAFSPDGRTLASGSSDMTIRLWSEHTHHQLGPPLTDHAGGVSGVAFSPDGRMLASARDDGSVALWDVRRRERIGRPLSGHIEAANAVSFSPDGRTLASAGNDQTIRFWDVRTHSPLRQVVPGITSRANGMAMAADGRTIAFASGNTTKLWDLRTNRAIGQPLRGPTAPVNTVAMSADGLTLAAAGDDRTIRLSTIGWRTVNEVTSEVCALVSSDLSKPEWAQYAAGITYRRSCS